MDRTQLEMWELDEVKTAIRDYHYALDTKQHVGYSCHRAIVAIMTTLNMPWVQGEEVKRRQATRLRHG